MESFDIEFKAFDSNQKYHNAEISLDLVSCFHQGVALRMLSFLHLWYLNAEISVLFHSLYKFVIQDYSYKLNRGYIYDSNDDVHNMVDSLTRHVSRSRMEEKRILGDCAL